MAILEAIQNSNASNHTLIIKLEDLLSLTGALANVTTAVDEPILPNDVENTISIVDNIIRLIFSQYADVFVCKYIYVYIHT